MTRWCLQKRGMRRAAALVGLVVLTAARAEAQPSDGRFELTGGLLWLGGYGLGGTEASETTSAGGESPFVLFRTGSDLRSAAGAHIRVGIRLTRAIVLEGGGSWSRPVVRTQISDDFEDAPATTAQSNLTQYLVDGALVVHLSGLAFGGHRAVPYVEAGAGHLRQLHEDGALVDTGQVLHAGGGLTVWLARRAAKRVSGLGLRTEARICVRRGGVDFEEDVRRTFGAAFVGLVVRF